MLEIVFVQSKQQNLKLIKQHQDLCVIKFYVFLRTTYIKLQKVELIL